MDTETTFIDLEKWRTRLTAWGLLGIVEAVLVASSPLAPLGAQLLYIGQPVLSLFWERRQIDQWAILLEDPHGLGWLREQLTEQSTDE